MIPIIYERAMSAFPVTFVEFNFFIVSHDFDFFFCHIIVMLFFNKFYSMMVSNQSVTIDKIK